MPAGVSGTAPRVAGIAPTPAAAAIGTGLAAAVAAGCAALSGVLGGGPVTPGSISPKSSTVSTMITCSVLFETGASTLHAATHAKRVPTRLYPGGTTKLRLCHRSALAMRVSRLVCFTLAAQTGAP